MAFEPCSQSHDRQNQQYYHQTDQPKMNTKRQCMEVDSIPAVVAKKTYGRTENPYPVIVVSANTSTDENEHGYPNSRSRGSAGSAAVSKRQLYSALIDADRRLTRILDLTDDIEDCCDDRWSLHSHDLHTCGTMVRVVIHAPRLLSSPQYAVSNLLGASR